jgi:hypothetical protein
VSEERDRIDAYWSEVDRANRSASQRVIAFTSTAGAAVFVVVLYAMAAGRALVDNVRRVER